MSRIELTLKNWKKQYLLIAPILFTCGIILALTDRQEDTATNSLELIIQTASDTLILGLFLGINLILLVPVNALAPKLRLSRKGSFAGGLAAGSFFLIAFTVIALQNHLSANPDPAVGWGMLAVIGLGWPATIYGYIFGGILAKKVWSKNHPLLSVIFIAATTILIMVLSFHLWDSYNF